MELIDVIASGYEWICPECEYINKMIEYPRRNSDVACDGCGEHVELSYPEHAFE